MTFAEILAQAIALLQQRGRLTYKTLQLQFHLDTAHLEALKDELIDGQRLAVDEGGRVLVWRRSPACPVVATVPQPAVSAPALLTSPSAALTSLPLSTACALEGERKQVTVLFADLKESMALLANRDPEEAHQLLEPVLVCMMDAVHRYEGTVNQVLGDGIMALFGAPYAYEDHAARACYAALAMQAALRLHAADVRRTHGVSLQMRVGLNSGEVVVRTIRNDLHVDYSAVGQTTHLAARMEQLATPGRIALTAATLRLVEGVVEVTPLGAVPIKGMAEPVEAFELCGATPGHRRGQGTGRHEGRCFVGRQAELTALQQALERAGTGQGQVVAIIGEAGVGKSRLMQELRHAPCTTGWRVLTSVALPYGQAIPYRALRDLLKQYIRLDDQDDAQTIGTKVRGQILTLAEELRDMLPAFLWLLDILPTTHPFMTLTPSQRSQRICQAITQLFLRASLSQPLLLILEDVHWLDAATETVLCSLMHSLPKACLLLLVSCRPDSPLGWSPQAALIQVRLAPLPPTPARALLQTLMGCAPSLAALQQSLITRTAGNPFFLEESVRSLVESQVLVGRPGDYTVTTTVVSFPVPATVQAVLASRMDRLGPAAKYLLQTAAVIGYTVPHALLRALTALSETALQECLRQLQTAEFLSKTCLFPEPIYTFQHALIHEVAYDTLLHAQRRILHAQVVGVLEALPGTRTTTQVAHLAHHSLRGAVWQKALRYYRQAGEQALARSAHQEAVPYFEAALQALAHLPEQRQWREQAIDLRLALRSALFPSGEAMRIQAYLHEAATLADALHDPRRLGRVIRFLSHDLNTRGAHTQAIATGKQALALARASGDRILSALVYRYIGAAFMARGNYCRAVDCFGHTVQHLHGVRCRERFGQVFLPAVLCRAYLAACHAELGTFAKGKMCGNEGLRMAQEANHPGSLMWAYRGRGLLALRQGDLSKAVLCLERAVGLCQGTALPAFFPVMAADLGAAYTLAGRADEAVSLLTRALAQCTSTSRADLEVLCRLALGEAHACAGRLEEAHLLAKHALTLARQYEEQSHQAYALHLLGTIAARQSPAAAVRAETWTRQALVLAKTLRMRPLVAHCHYRLGNVYYRQGHLEKARTTLSTAITLYRTMAMTFWLPQAEALLWQVER